MTSAMPHRQYARAVYDHFANMAGGYFDIEYQVTAFNMTENDCVSLAQRIFDESWPPRQGLFAHEWPIKEVYPSSYENHVQFAKAVQSEIAWHQIKLRNWMNATGIPTYSLTAIIRLQFSAKEYQQVHRDAMQQYVFARTWYTKRDVSESTRCFRDLKQTFRRTIEEYMRVECYPKNLLHFRCFDDKLVQECERRRARLRWRRRLVHNSDDVIPQEFVVW